MKMNIWSILRLFFLLVIILHFLDSGVDARKKRKKRNKQKREGVRDEESSTRKSKRNRRTRSHLVQTQDRSVDTWPTPTLLHLFQEQQAHKNKANAKKVMYPNHVSTEHMLNQYKEKREKVEPEISPIGAQKEILVAVEAKVEFLINRPNSRHFYAHSSTISTVTSPDLDLLPVHTASGKFGMHTAARAVFGRLIHITDVGRSSHFGCAGGISNTEDIPKDGETWVALIARGHCSFLTKIKLAQQHGAIAAIIYDHSNHKVTEMFTLGTRIVSLAIGKDDGHRMAKLADSGTPVMVRVSVGETKETTSTITSIATRLQTYAMESRHEEKGGNSANIFNQSATLTLLFALISLVIQRHVVS